MCPVTPTSNHLVPRGDFSMRSAQSLLRAAATHAPATVGAPVVAHSFSEVCSPLEQELRAVRTWPSILLPLCGQCGSGSEGG